MRSRARTGDLTFLIGGLVLMAGLTVLSVVLTPPDTAPRHSGSSYAPYPDGAKAAYVFLQESGYIVERSLDPIAAVAAEPLRSVLILADPLQPPSELDRAALEAFAEAGGTVLATGPSAVAFLPGLTEGDVIRRTPAAPRSYTPGVPSPLARNAASVEMTPGPRRIRASEHPWIPVYGDERDPAVLTARVGSGRIVWWASSRPLSNGAISVPGHLELLLNVIGPAGDRRVLWDEHYHGHTRSLWSYSTGTPIAWGLAQLGLLGAAALFTFGRRLGPTRSRVLLPRASPLEFIDTMGALYERAAPEGAAVATARSRVRRLLQSRSGLPSSAPDAQLVAAVAGRVPIDGVAARALLERSEAAAHAAALPEREAVAILAELQTLAARIGPSPLVHRPSGRGSA